MKQMFYVEELDKFFESQEDAVKAEKEYKEKIEARKKAELQRKEEIEKLKAERGKRAQEVKDAINTAAEKLETFIKDYGAFHWSINQNDITEDGDLFDRFFTNFLR